MAKSKVKKIGDTQRPINTVRNDFTSADGYGPSDALSPNGKGEVNGVAGSAADISQRTSTLARNLFTSGSRYSVDD